MIPGIKYCIEKYPYPGSQLTVVIYSSVLIVLIRELIIEQFQRALVPAEFPSPRLLPGRSGIAAGWTMSGWRMLRGLLVLHFTLDKQSW